VGSVLENNKRGGRFHLGEQRKRRGYLTERRQESDE
jgi:hypothetical protein